MVEYLVFVAKVTIAMTFVISSVSKGIAPKEFEYAIADFKVAPVAWSKPLAYSFITLEFCTGLLMIFNGFLLVLGFVISILLLLTFSIVLSLALYRRLNLSCNCFGHSERQVSYYDVLRNCLLIGFSIGGILGSIRQTNILTIRDEILLLFICGICVAVITNLEDIIETVRHPLTVTSGEG